MDWIQLGESASRLINALAIFNGNAVDVNSTMTVANENDPNWSSNSDLRRSMYQALDLLERQSMISGEFGGSIRLTDRGSRTVGTPPSAWMPDPEDPSTKEWIELQNLVEAMDAERPGNELTITHLSVSNWRQFSSVELQIHPRLTILTGANAAGKTTLLNLFAPHFNWNAQLVSKGQETKISENPAAIQIGQLHYSNGVHTNLWHHSEPGISMSNVHYTGTEPVPGIFISSHRSVSSYRPLESLPARFSAADTMLQQFASEVQSRYSGGSSQYPPLYRMKEALISAALHGYGNQVVRETLPAIDIWEGFQNILGSFLPEDLQFENLIVENGELLLKTATGEFPIEAASGGLSAMLELSWQIFLRGQHSPSFTVCIDEPENHLHPELQRIIVPALLEAFPQATFIIATHSPFVVTSTRDCAVYALGRFGEDDKISSQLLDRLNASGTADETLQSVLGLETALPLWAQKAVADAVESIPEEATGDDLRQLRSKLIELGLDRQFPAAVAAIGEGHN
ncbi:AAA family ATPase [Rhodococcus sp. ACPA4]|uniref:AAA family ATPase n=1 Tax=Rhodococcus sp. ACPA4 TaxID=2028571 RepID=UPI0015C8449A|nr:ATP-binding protein [Rhodococcus sp. ACPA4]